MRFCLILLTTLAVALPAIAQNNVTVTATRPVNSQPDLVLLAVDVITDVNTTRDEVVAALQGSIVAGANLVSVRTVQGFVLNGTGLGSTLTLDWTFTITAPLSNFKTTLTQLTALQQLIAQKKNGMSLSFSVGGTQLSPQAQQAQTCSTSDLLSDARAQAQKMAVAAGAGLGNILAISGATVTQPSNGTLFGAAVSLPNCTMTVKFALTGF